MTGAAWTVQKPPALRRGDRVAVVSPASYPEPERLARGMEALRELGLEPVASKYALRKTDGYFAGDAAERLADLHEAFLDRSIRAIFSTRGGYGSNYLLPGLDLELVRRNPKPFLGYSDLTAIQTWLLDQTGLAAFHGPFVAGDFSREGGIDPGSFLSATGGGTWAVGAESGLRTLRPGRASGVLYGGCLSMLAASLGTPYAPRTEGRLLFLEDVGERPYRLDRMLRQMLLAGKFEGATGIVFGEMQGCGLERDAQALDAMILRVLEGFEGPVGIGLRSGHVSRGNVTLVFGLEAELDLGAKPRLAFLESAVEAG